MFLNPSLETKKAYTTEFGDSDELVGSFPLSRRAFRRENRSEFVPNTKTGTKFWIWDRPNATHYRAMVSNWKYYGIECPCDSHVLWSEQFLVLNRAETMRKAREEVTSAV